MMPECIRELRTYGALVGCYEEDKDWCLVALSFPALFDDHAIDAALATLESPLATGLKPGQTFCGPSWPEFDWSAFWASEAGREVKRRTDTYRSAMADRWQVCGYGSGGHGWTVSAKHRTTGEYASLRFDSLHGMPSGMPSGPFRIEDYAERVIARAAA
jgi:hypothetical protein